MDDEIDTDEMRPRDCGSGSCREIRMGWFALDVSRETMRVGYVSRS